MCVPREASFPSGFGASPSYGSAFFSFFFLPLSPKVDGLGRLSARDKQDPVVEGNHLCATTPYGDQDSFDYSSWSFSAKDIFAPLSALDDTRFSTT